uniref:Paraquat-inducible protein B n=1 Tax=Candidatus Kentrum sp. SD TaxID=2126332 RepID=A0A451BNV2_9GAMM|nr:MAG: paraquat-inducible protein B [Candidatus Kentron sp. SD]
MTEASERQSAHLPAIADPVIAPERGADSLSPIWILPLFVVLIAVLLFWYHYTTQGPLITITFDSAEGIRAGRTPIKYLDVEMGRVQKIGIDRKSRKRVIVTARMEKGARGYLNETTKFWVVRPRVGFSGITGLQTLVSGNYIGMSGVATGGETRAAFRGLEQPPLTSSDAPGLRVRLRASEAGYIEPGSPVFYRRFKVGAVESRRLSEDGKHTEFQVFIHAPYDKFINTNTRFWNASGIDVMLDATGVTMHSESLETVISGGIAFSNPPRLEVGNRIESGATFTLYDTRTEAETRSVEETTRHLGYVLHFDESLHGLKVGAVVEHRGVRIGYVADIGIQYNRETGLFETPTLIFLDPQRIKWPADTRVEEILKTAVEKHGMRARLQTANMLTGALFVDLVLLSPDEERARNGKRPRIIQKTPYPEFPTVHSPFGQMTTKAVNLLDTVRALPLEKLVSSASRFFEDARALLGGPTSDRAETGARENTTMGQAPNAPLVRFLEAMTSTLTGLDAILGTQESRELPGHISASLGQLDATLKSIQGLLQGNTTSSSLSYEFSTALQELTQAARAVRSLTETIESKPNSLIFGK